MGAGDGACSCGTGWNEPEPELRKEAGTGGGTNDEDAVDLTDSVQDSGVDVDSAEGGSGDSPPVMVGCEEPSGPVAKYRAGDAGENCGAMAMPPEAIVSAYPARC